MNYQNFTNRDNFFHSQKVFKLALFTFAIIGGLFIFSFSFAHAEELLDLNMPKMPGTVSGAGTHFEITDSSYLNIILNSSEEINLKIESMPEMVTMTIEPVSSATSTQITLSGFTPLTTYYKYEDDYHNLTEFIADENGNYSYIQNLTTPHLIFIQPRKSTKFIKDDATGGDCYLIGNWDASTKTCTLTTDVYETIQIDNNNITLDGNNHKIIGNNTGNGIYLSNKSGVAIKNLNVEKFTSGITLSSSNGNMVFNDTATLNGYNGIYLEWSFNNTVNNNLVNSNYQGILLYYSSNNTLNNNVANFNTRAGIYLNQYSNFNNVINNIASSNNYGIYLAVSSNNIVSNNVFDLNNSYGSYLWGYRSSWLILPCNDNIFNNNTFSNSYSGIQLDSSNNNQIYNNNFINNQVQVRVSGSGNVFNLATPIGGNYWSNFDTPAEGCNDLNNDNVYDSSYFFWGGADYLPWMKKDGWITNQPPTVANLNQYKSDGITAISESAITTEDVVVFKAIVSDADNDQIKLQIELKEFNQAFNEQDLLESEFVSSGGEAIITRYGLIDGQYKWRARAIDSQGNVSGWREFGAAGNMDFEVQLPLSYKAAKLAKLVINAPYLGDGDTYGGKGWNPIERLYVGSDKIFAGYNYWNNKLRKIKFGAGLDCSGLIQWAYNYSFDSRKSLLRNAIRYDGADGQYKNNTETIAEVDLKPGNLLFLDKGSDNFIDHVAMYVGEGDGYNIVEAFSPTDGIIPSNITEFKTRAGFSENKHIRRVVLSPSIGGQVKAGSPIDLIVTDPDGFTITSTTSTQTDEEYLREIPGEFYYTENLLGDDGRPEDIVYWPKQKTGDYIIKVLPENDVVPTETYSLEFTVGEQTTILADDTPLNQIPSEGYGINVESGGAINTFIPVLIDVKPDSYPNSVNLGSNGVIPVVIFGSATLNVRQIDPATIKFANASVKLKGNGQLIVSYSDVNEDGFIDITANVITDALQLTENDVKANLEAKLIDGAIIKGSDSVRIVP